MLATTNPARMATILRPIRVSARVRRRRYSRTHRLRQPRLREHRRHQPLERPAVRILSRADDIHHLERGLRTRGELAVRRSQRRDALAPAHDLRTPGEAPTEGRYQDVAPRLHAPL